MNPYDDVDPDDRYPTRPTQHYLCANCNHALVLKLGDYCLKCAVIPPKRNEYIVLSPAMLDSAVEKSGMAREFLVAKMNQAFERYQHYVIFRVGNEWRDIVVSDRFFTHIRYIMQNLFKRLEE